MRNCGCADRGRHQRTCVKHTERKDNEIEPMYSKDGNLQELYIQAYGKPPHLSWYPNKGRQKTVEHRIKNLVRRYKSFYLTTTSVDDDLQEEETWYIDGGNWASKTDSNGYNILIGHGKNCLEFLGGRQPKWGKRRRKS